MKNHPDTAAIQSQAHERAVGLPARTHYVHWITSTACVLLVLIAGACLYAVFQQVDAARSTMSQAQRTYATAQQLRLALARLQAANASEHGFILTGREEFLQPYYEAEASLTEPLQQLDKLPSDPQFGKLVQQLRRLADAQMKFLRAVVEARRQQGKDAATALIAQGEGERNMKAVRTLVEEMRGHMDRLLAASTADMEVRSQRVAIAIRLGLFAAAILMVLIIAASLALVWHLRQRLRAEQQAQAAYAVLRATLDNVNQGVAVFDKRFRLATWNELFPRFRGVDSSQMWADMTPEDLASSDSLLQFNFAAGEDRQVLLRHIRQGEEMDLEASRPDGAFLQIRGRPMPNGSYIVTIADVTSLRVSKANYRDQAVRLAAILDNIVDGIVTINESGSIESWSKGAERLLAYRAEEVLRRDFGMLFPEPRHSTRYLQQFMHMRGHDNLRFRREVEALHKDGHRVPVELGISEMQMNRRRLFIAVMRDISDRREIERLKSGFVSTVSHELRTPLTSISGSLGLLAGGAAGELPPKSKRLIDIAKVNCERLVRLINDILDLEKAESGRLDFQMEEQELRPIVEQVVESMRSFADQFQVKLALHSDPQDANARVIVDRDRLIQVLTNLVSNASKFSPPHSTVDLEIRSNAASGSMEVLIKDRGPGIPKEFQPRMFERFAQADSSDSRDKGGTGLGLSIAKAIIERLGGSIGFESVEGRGTTFFLTLPTRQEISSATPAAANHVSEGRAVLVCEDDPDVAAVLCEMLRSAGMSADAAGTARAAKAALLNAHYDLALIDLHLPDMEGTDFIAELRQQTGSHALPIIVMTSASHSSNKTIEAMHTLQLADWLQKPIDPQRLHTAIERALATKPGSRLRVLHIEDDVPLTTLVRELLSDEADVQAAHTLDEGQQLLREQPFDLIILDVSLADGSGLEVLDRLRQTGSGLPPVILYSATEPSPEMAQRVQGALVKSRHSLDQLINQVRALTRQHQADIVDTSTDGTH